MTRRWIFLGVGIAAVLLLTAGFGLAAGQGTGVDAGRSDGALVAACDAMHRSQEMQDLHASMPEDVRAPCEAMHAQMGRMMAGMGSMMDGSGMTGPGMGSGMMGSGMMGSGMMGADGGVP